MPVVQETISQRQLKAEAILNTTFLRVTVDRDEINRIYGPGVIFIPSGRKVKVLLTKLNLNHPMNPSGDIWVRVKESKHGLEMWMLDTWLWEEEGDN